ncbi:hypothetical protein CEXT_145421 [Caerostris extrusa]|uniref:Uncharacterized protein n=1 Tax=Caerostris extrusa TaxID=172846 RepID=A0AAV4Q6V0_CAEEX|nr:hypothetical protein CEXT_145421 [Caerostris extrusa]
MSLIALTQPTELEPSTPKQKKKKKGTATNWIPMFQNTPRSTDGAIPRWQDLFASRRPTSCSTSTSIKFRKLDAINHGIILMVGIGILFFLCVTEIIFQLSSSISLTSYLPTNSAINFYEVTLLIVPLFLKTNVLNCLTQNLKPSISQTKETKKEGTSTNRIPMFQNTPRSHRRCHTQMTGSICHSKANIMLNFHKYQVQEVRCNQSRNALIVGTGILFFCTVNALPSPQNLNLPSPKQKKEKKEGTATNRIPMLQNTPDPPMAPFPDARIHLPLGGRHLAQLPQVSSPGNHISFVIINIFHVLPPHNVAINFHDATLLIVPLFLKTNVLNCPDTELEPSISKTKRRKKEGTATNRIPMFQNTPRSHRRRHSQMPIRRSDSFATRPTSCSTSTSIKFTKLDAINH